MAVALRLSVPAARAPPKKSVGSAAPAIPGLSWDHSWLPVAVNPPADPYSACTTPAAGVLPRRSDGQVGWADAIEVASSQGAAEEVLLVRPPGRPPSGHGAMAYVSEEFEVDDADVAAVLAWAETTVLPDRTYTLYALVDCDGAAGLVRLAGTDPTAPSRDER